MIDFSIFASPEAWVSLATLSLLEIILGIDNLVFLSILADRLPSAQRPLARKIGLLAALGTRLLLLSMISWMTGLTNTLFTILTHDISWRDLILISGGLFLLTKGTSEIHHKIEASEDPLLAMNPTHHGFAWIITQIAIMDIVFSFDSVITAVGMAQHLIIMISAVVLSMVIMVIAVDRVAGFINENPTIKMLALSFLLLIGLALTAEGLDFHIPKGYLYFAICFSLFVEWLNLLVRRKRTKPLKRS